MKDELFTQLPNRSYTIRVNSATTEVPIQACLDRLFEKQPVAVTDATDTQEADLVVVRDGEPVARSDAEDVLESVLLVNSDVYTTGSRGLTDAKLPAVLEALQEVPFLVRGYPESNSEKMLLLAVSRAIERRAYEAGSGTLHVGFQELSRLVDEHGTYRVYEQLSTTEMEIHLYGNGDVAAADDLAVTVHTGDSWFHRHAWFVVFTPETTERTPAALYSVEREANRWGGFWTFQSERVKAIRTEINNRTQPPQP